MSNSSTAWLSQVHFLSLNIKGNPIFISFSEPQFPHLGHGLGIWKALRSSNTIWSNSPSQGKSPKGLTVTEELRTTTCHIGPGPKC